MLNLETTTLWKSSLGSKAGSVWEQKQRKRLRDAFLKFRERAETLAAEIARDIPNLTAHDITHLDALWENASLIAGKNYVLTPTEAFVLGGAFLVHDLAMSRAAYSEGLDELRSEPAWQDTIVSLMRRKLGRFPSQEELDNPDKETEDRATGELIRLFHARQAEHLPTTRWQLGEEGEPYYLIEDTELRETYAPIIGRIAHSHWWAVERLAEEFHTLGAPGGYPVNWEADALKVACLLRVADASHLDERRAPSFLYALRKPDGVSHDHWKFQNLLFQPRLKSDRLVYTSKRAFTLAEASAWWICFDALRMVDDELRQVDSILSDSNKPRLAARGVSRIESPSALVDVIPTQGWLPVNAQVKVTDVAALARNIGGEQLYGDDRTIPLREMIQNACDAVRARRVLQNLPENWGDVCVRLGSDTDGSWIEVEDNGVGMSTAVLTGPLLDFGTSYWGSELMLREYPGLLSKGFQATGRFGIGFFSVFMWGDRVRIATRRYDSAEKDTHILEFGSGITNRPILRKAENTETRAQGGTQIRIWLRHNPNSAKGFLSSRTGRRGAWVLDELCEWLCPSVDVNIYAQTEPADSKKVIAASDWIALDPLELHRRLNLDVAVSGKANLQLEEKRTISNLRLLKDSSGAPVGRASISFNSLGRKRESDALVTTGGLRATEISGLFGLFAGIATNAARTGGIPLVESTILASWASEQAPLVLKAFRNIAHRQAAAGIIRLCGGDTGKLPIAYYGRRWISSYELHTWKKSPSEIFLVSDYDLLYSTEHGKLKLNKNVLGVEYYYRRLYIMNSGFDEEAWPRRSSLKLSGKPNQFRESIKMAVIEALAKAWKVTFDDVFQASDFSGVRVEIGKRGAKLVKMEADIIRDPNRLTVMSKARKPPRNKRSFKS